MTDKQARDKGLAIALAIHRLVNKVDDNTLERIKPELNEIEHTTLELLGGIEEIKREVQNERNG
jgi:hypothetical protein